MSASSMFDGWGFYESPFSQYTAWMDIGVELTGWIHIPYLREFKRHTWTKKRNIICAMVFMMVPGARDLVCIGLFLSVLLCSLEWSGVDVLEVLVYTLDLSVCFLQQHE